MIISQGYKYNFAKEISEEEYEIINEFLAHYRKQFVIVADNYKQDFSMISSDNNGVVFNSKEEKWKSVSFCRRFFHKEKPYVVELDLLRTEPAEDSLKCIGIHEFKIFTNGEVHFITLATDDIIKRKILFNIASIFDEKKIISPEQAYSKQMYTDKALQSFIENHEWQKIATGISQRPELANALFIIREEFKSHLHYCADFGTILYQLISFRMNKLSDFDAKDLRELDKLILELAKTRLLKVQLQELMQEITSPPTKSILLDADKHSSKIHSSHQYTVYNTELLEEQRILNKCLSNSSTKSK